MSSNRCYLYQHLSLFGRRRWQAIRQPVPTNQPLMGSVSKSATSKGNT